MKIALYCQHDGLRDMMLNLLEDHVIQQCRITVYGDRDLSNGTEDVIISTWPHLDLILHKGTKPVIIYATNPILEVKIFTQIQEQPWCTIIDDELGKNCYKQEWFPIKPKYSIPHSINPDKYPKYSGEIKMVAIAQNKPFSRWQSVTRNQFGDHYELTQLFAYGVPFVFIHTPANQRRLFFETLTKYRVCFYYSDTPYTLFLYELMAIGMPIVAFDNNLFKVCTTNDPLEKYGIPRSTNPEQINSLVSNFLNKPPVPIKYPIRPFKEIKEMWNEAVQSVIRR